jgi:excisionase family DNA binding protein
MSDGTREPPAGYVTVGRAREQLGVSRMTMYRLLRRHGVQTYADPRDARTRLLKTEDVDRLQQPIPIPHQAVKTAA